MSILPQVIKERLTQRAKHTLDTALSEDGFSPLSLLCALYSEKGSLAKNILSHALKASNFLRRQIVLRQRYGHIRHHPDLRRVVIGAAQKAAEQNQPYIGTEHLLYGLIAPLAKYYKTSPRTPPFEHMDVAKILTPKNTFQIKKHLDTIFAHSDKLPTLEDILSQGSFEFAQAPKSAGGHRRGLTARRSKKSAKTALDVFCENLNTLSEEGKIDPIIGREKEMERILCILSRRTKNNPLLIGDPGVGKTAIVHGLAQRINRGEVPLDLLNKKILALNLNGLVAGTIFRGDFEARMHQIIKESARRDIILFIDEIHTLIGAGAVMGTLDAANILKPALADGTLRCIGATTLDEYKKYIEKERALERRFQPVIVEEETEEQSIRTLLNLKKLYEKHHEITIEDEAVKTSVRLASRYLQDRFLPDKALDLLDEAASRLKNSAVHSESSKILKQLEMQKAQLISQKETAIANECYKDAVIFKNRETACDQEIRAFKRKFLRQAPKITLKKEHIEETVAQMCGIPAAKTSEGPALLKNLAKELAEEIIGQDDAISEIVQILTRKKAGLTKDSGTYGAFLFLGPSGVGKTALAKALAAKTSRTLISLNMAEYAEPHTVSRLIGSPPGYIGYGEGGELTEKVRRGPYSVVLFDEIEKAHPQVQSLLLPILEEGTLADATGRKVSFRNAIIILTSNLCAEDESKSFSLGLVKSGEADEFHAKKYLEDMREYFRPEIISRMDKIIVLNRLSHREIRAISELFARKLINRLSNFSFSVEPKVIDFVANQAMLQGEGARHVRASIEKYVEYPLAEFILKNPEIKKAKAILRGDEISIF